MFVCAMYSSPGTGTRADWSWWWAQSLNDLWVVVGSATMGSGSFVSCSEPVSLAESELSNSELSSSSSCGAGIGVAFQEANCARFGDRV